MLDDTFKQDLESLLATALGQPATIAQAQPLAGGASMETWAFDVAINGTTLPLVMRRDMAMKMYAGALNRAEEYRLLEVVHGAGILAPRPRLLSEQPPRPFFIMDRLPGESVGRRVVRLPELAGARAGLAAEMGRQLAAIHAIPLTPTLDFLRARTAGDVPEASPAENAVAFLRRTVDAMGLHNPVWAWALRWLSRHLPTPSGRLVLVHGDFRIGNLLVTPEGLSGVIDWEFAHIGDPLEDLAWPLMRDWRFGNDHLPVGGIGTLDPYLEAYTAASGQAVDRVALRWWEIANNLRWAIFCHAQAERHLSGQDRSVEYASLGRKAAEVEWEILTLIQQERAP